MPLGCENVRPEPSTHRGGKYNGPVPNALANTAGRAVSRRLKVGMGASGQCPGKQDTQTG
jgi:hypothetical protein